MLKGLAPVSVFSTAPPADPGVLQGQDRLNRTLALAILVAIPAFLDGAAAGLSVSFDTAGRPSQVSIQGAPAGVRLQLVDGVNPIGVVVVDRSGGASGPHTIHALEWGAGNVALMRNKGGLFGPSIPLAAIIEPAGIAMGDFDGDGKADLVVGCNKVTVLPGDGKRLLFAIRGNRGFQRGRRKNSIVCNL